MYDWAELRQFRYLLAILEHQGFRAAAETLHTAQSNLSAHAKQFQENTSVLLYRRTKSGRIRPTEAGLAFIPLARHLLETKNEVIDALVAIHRGDVRSVRLGCCPWVDATLFRSSVRLHRELAARCTIRAMYGDTVNLVDEVLSGAIDAAFVTLPAPHPELHAEMIQEQRIVACMRADHPLAEKQAVPVDDLREHLAVLYHPERHPDAHRQLVQTLAASDITVGEYSRASTPAEMQLLVKEGYGLALLQEGLALDDELTTRPLAGLRWVMNTSVIYHRQRYPKTIPVLIKMLRRSLSKTSTKPEDASIPLTRTPERHPPRAAQAHPKQLKLLDRIR